MKIRSTSNNRHASARLSAVLLAVLLLLPACARRPQPAGIEEITFQSGKFTLVGDLRIPAGTGPFAVVLFVHGSGNADRTFFGIYLPIMERMLRAGYAVFSWDKPGTGESTGTLDPSRVISERVQILLDAIEVMKTHRDIDPRRIGLWGGSQAGLVMPRVLMASDDIAFLICQSCGSMSSQDEWVYQIVAQGYCGGVAEEDANQLEILLAELDKARTFDTYEGYLRYRQVLDELAALVSVTVPEPVVSEAAWLANKPVPMTWSPVHVFEQVRIPVLAIWGERDTQIDPIWGAYAYRDALEQAAIRNIGSRSSRAPPIPSPFGDRLHVRRGSNGGAVIRRTRVRNTERNGFANSARTRAAYTAERLALHARVPGLDRGMAHRPPALTGSEALRTTERINELFVRVRQSYRKNNKNEHTTCWAQSQSLRGSQAGFLFPVSRRI